MIYDDFVTAPIIFVTVFTGDGEGESIGWPLSEERETNYEVRVASRERKREKKI